MIPRYKSNWAYGAMGTMANKYKHSEYIYAVYYIGNKTRRKSVCASSGFAGPVLGP